MTKYRKHTKIAEQEQEQQQFSNFLDRARYSHGQKLRPILNHKCQSCTSGSVTKKS